MRVDSINLSQHFSEELFMPTLFGANQSYFCMMEFDTRKAYLFDYDGKMIYKEKKILPSFLKKHKVNLQMSDSSIWAHAPFFNAIYKFNIQGNLTDSLKLKKNDGDYLVTFDDDEKSFVLQNSKTISQKKKTHKKYKTHKKCLTIFDIAHKRTKKFYDFPKHFNHKKLYINPPLVIIEKELIYVKSQISPEIAVYSIKGKHLYSFGQKSSVYQYVEQQTLDKIKKFTPIFTASNFVKEQGKENFAVFYPTNYMTTDEKTHMIYQMFENKEFAEMTIEGVYPISYTKDDKIYFFKPTFPQALLIYQLK